MKRLSASIPLAIVSLCAVACSGPPATPDVTIVDDRSTADVAPVDDLVSHDAADVTDAGGPVDVVLPADAGPCHVANTPVVLFEQAVGSARPVSLLQDSDGYDFTVPGLTPPVGEAIWFLATDPTGSAMGMNPVTHTPPTAHVTGGALTMRDRLYSLVYTSDETGSPQVYGLEVQGNAMPIATSRTQLSFATVPVDSPAITLRAAGFIAAWRARESSGGRVVIQGIGPDLALDGAPSVVTETGFDVESFRLVSSPADMTYAIVYIGTRGGTRELRVSMLDASMSPNASVLVASGPMLGSEIDAVADGSAVALVWTQLAGPPLVMQIVQSGGGDAGAPFPIDRVSAPASAPGIAREALHWVIAYRAGSGNATFLGLVRVARDRTVRDVSLLSVAAPGGRVGVATATGGRYAVGSADDYPTRTIARFMVLTCPQ
ncbi:MAG: hypothetical protein WCJ30_07945 [Deltaproteobacteria bacterium]